MKDVYSNKDGTSAKKNKVFYTAAIVCGVAIIAAGYMVADNMGLKNGKDTTQIKVTVSPPTAQPAPTPGQKALEPVTGTVTDVAKATPKPSSKATTSQKPKTATAAAAASTLDKTKLAMPVAGQISVHHSNDALVYSPTFNDWRTHNGVDIDANVSDQVKAVADGVVEKVYTDNQLGIVIVIRHGDFKTLYGNLSTDSMVKEGKAVKKGDIISGIGNTAAAEASQKPHLHFEVLYGDKSVDPEKFLP